MDIPWGPWAVYPGVWLDDDSPLLEATGLANAWGSKGGIEGAEFSYFNAADRPTIVESSLNSRRTLSFDATDYLTSTQSGLMNLYRNVSDAWMFAVFRRETHDAGAAVVRPIVIFAHSTTLYRVGLRITSGPSGNDGLVGFGGRRLDSDSYNEVLSGTIAPATWHIALGRINYTTREIDLRVDGESVASASGAFSGAGLTENSASGRARVGANVASTPDVFLDGSLAAVLCGNTQLSDQDCEKLEGWAAHRYGVTSNLPLGHPYKTDEATFDLTTPYAPSPVSISNGGHALGFETTRIVSPTRARPNFYFDPNARGRIVGTVKRKDTPENVPLSRRVRLYRDRDGMLIAEKWSDAAGNYQFDYIEEGEAYTVIAHDYTKTYRAVVADNINLENGSIILL